MDTRGAATARAGQVAGPTRVHGPLRAAAGPLVLVA